MKRSLWTVSFVAVLLGCSVDTESGSLAQGGKGQSAGASSSGVCAAPTCDTCKSCFERCVCETNDATTCVHACANSGSGGASAGGGGGAPTGGGTPGSGGTSSGGSPGSGGASAGGSPGGGGASGGGGSSGGGTCCTPGTSAGCSDASIESCVCAQDDYCCKTAWDKLCVDEVDSFGCGSCAGGGGAGGSSGSGGTSGGGGAPGGGGSSGSGGSGGASGGGGSSGGGGVAGSGGSGGFPAGAVVWKTFAEQHSNSNAGWSSYMTDVIRHLPLSYGNTYYDSDKVTYVHETTHGINSHLRNYLNDTGKKANAFYVGGNKFALVVEPKMLKSDANPYVPQSLRDSRYSLYLQGSTDWNDTPLYLFDEWVAYTNGTEAGVNLVKEGKWNAGWRDSFGSLEFTVYALAVGMAAEAKDPSYFTGYAQFREFLKWNAERAMSLYQQTKVMTEFKWDKMDSYYGKIQTSADAAQLRSWVKKTYGDTWTKNVMGF